MRPKPDNHISLSFPSLSANEAFARMTAACFAAQLNPTVEELEDVKTAVSEAVTNCIVHAYPETPGLVTLTARLYGNTLELRIKDRGAGISDIPRAMTPLFTTGGEDRSGMGFTIMESFMDTLQVHSSPGHGTSVIMRKQFQSQPSEEANEAAE